MGLFVADDGRYQGWLASVLCCIAALNEDEHPAETRRSRPSTRTGTGVWLEQPPPITALPRLYTAVHDDGSKGIEPVSPISDDGSTKPVLGRAPSLEPLDFGDSALIPRVHRRRGSSTGHAKKPSIGAPSAFRRLEYTDGQRASLVPLRLPPVVLRETPTPDPLMCATVTETVASQPNQRSVSTQDLVSPSKRESYREQRETPFQRCQQRSTTSLIARPSMPPSAKSSPTISQGAAAVEQLISRPSTSRQSSSSSLRRQTLEFNVPYVQSRPSTSTHHAQPRLSGERNRLKRKRSLQNVRKPYVDSAEGDIEKEVLELNTIVEERRTEARPQSPEHQHVAAIAPAMSVRARSETLNDIGSALARPLTAREPHRMHTVFDSPEKVVRPSTSRAPSRTSSRVSGWLSGLLTTSSAPAAPNDEPFYKCVPPTRPRPQSEASLCSSVTALESPSLTHASSPTSKGHSRSVTAESRITPSLPPSFVYDHEMPDIRKEAEEHWPLQIAHSQVGLAI